MRPIYGRAHPLSSHTSTFRQLSKCRNDRPLPFFVARRSFFDEKSDLPLPGLRRFHELADGFEQGADVGIVTRDFPFRLGQLGRHFFVRGDHLTQSDQGPHHKDAHLHGSRRAEHTRQHDGPMLGKGIGCVSASASSFV